jgi:hypothetical protein
MNIIAGLFDRLLFAVGFIVLMQLPNFVDHYTQRMGGFHAAMRTQLNEYQLLADRNYRGELDALISDFRASSQPAVARTGEQIDTLRHREAELGEGLVVLEGGVFLRKLAYLAGNLDLELAEGTARNFKPGLPLTAEAAVCGLLGGILFSLLFNGLLWWPRRRRRLESAAVEN